MHIDIDNKDCKKDVKNFKTKLERKIVFFEGRESQSKAIMDQKEYILALKHAGIEKNTH